MTASPHRQPITITEYLEGEEHSPVKHEYLGGAVHAMSGGTNRHGIIAGNAFGLFYNQLRGKPCQPFNSDAKVRIELPDHTRFYYPDAMVVCRPNPLADTYQEHPVVVVEVLSDSTRRTDMGEKRDAYLERLTINQQSPVQRKMEWIGLDGTTMTSYDSRRMHRTFPTNLLLACSFGLAAPAPGATVLAMEIDRVTKCWSFEYGLSLITSDNIGEILSGTVHVDDGPAGGEIHSFTAARLLAEPEWVLFGKSFRPVIDLPLTLAVFDENARAPFADYNAAVRVRWRDFPWNHLVTTTFATGVGLSYSSKIPAMDQQRHPNSNRSHLKFDWPIQITLAHPAHPEHQLTLFIAHQSGGRIFDQGGINSIGIGYCFARW